jgi:ABC-type amino acid transport substrate-binding protein
MPAPVAASSIQTLEKGKLKVGVTGICTDDSPHHNCWVHKIMSDFARIHGLELELVVVKFDNSWALAANDQLDVVATGITPLPERAMVGISNSDYYSIVKRGLRIHREDSEKFSNIDDFVGYRVGAVKGMTAHKDLLNRTPAGVEIVAPDTWEELYELFKSGYIQGIAEGFYVFPDDPEDLNNYDAFTTMVDIHDLNFGELEGNTFVVRDGSSYLLEELNEYIKNSGLPNHRP